MSLSLFSIFDPITFMPFASHWIVITAPPILMPRSFWKSMSRPSALLLNISNYLFTQFSPTINRAPYLIMLVLWPFMFILVCNTMGLLPYVSCITSQLILTVPLALYIWVALMLHAALFNLPSILTHLVPQNAPIILAPLMVLIETTSNLIRPMTLALRLAANMIAGHLLLTLLSSATPAATLILTPFLLIPQILLTILEMAVSIIQAYVFSVLASLYLAESLN